MLNLLLESCGRNISHGHNLSRFCPSCVRLVCFLCQCTEFHDMRTECQRIIINSLLLISHKSPSCAKRCPPGWVTSMMITPSKGMRTIPKINFFSAYDSLVSLVLVILNNKFFYHMFSNHSFGSNRSFFFLHCPNRVYTDSTKILVHDIIFLSFLILFFMMTNVVENV